MTEKNKRANIQEELHRAETAPGAGDLRHDGGFESDAVSRLYCYVSHMVRALLRTKGIEPKPHEAALRLWSLHSEKSNRFTVRDARAFTRFMKYRAEADSSAAYLCTSDDVKEFKEDAVPVGDHIIQ